MIIIILTGNNDHEIIETKIDPSKIITKPLNKLGLMQCKATKKRMS